MSMRAGRRAGWLPLVLAALLLASAALFGIGVAVERGTSESHPERSTAESARPGAGSGSGSGAEAAEGGSGQHAESEEGERAAGSAAGAAAREPGDARGAGQGGEQPERVLGVRVEAGWTVTGALVASVALAVAVWRWRRWPVLVAVVVFAAGATALDMAEAAHQFGEGRAGSGLLAVLVALAHAAAVVVAAVLLRSPRPALAR